MTKSKRGLYISIAVGALLLIIIITVVSITSSNKSNSTNVSGPDDTTEADINQSDTKNTITYSNIPTSKTDVDIANYDSTVSNLPNSRKQNAQKMLLYTLKDNNINYIPNDITIRDGSYSQILDDKDTMYTTTYIVDIPSINQSYRITDYYSPVEENNPVNYATVVTCLEDNELIYGNFNCTDQIKGERGE